MSEHLHTIEQIRTKCIGLGIIIETLRQMRTRNVSPVLIEHEVDGLIQQWDEINHEAALSDLAEIVSAAGKVA